MNILQINKYYPPVIGGIESVVKDVAESLSEYGWNVTTLVCQNQTGNASTVETIQGSRVHRSRTWMILFRLPLSFDFFKTFRREAKDADVILLHHPFPLGFFAYRFFGLKKPLVVFYHSDIIRQKFFARVLHPLTQQILSRAQRIFVTSERLQKNSSVLRLHQKKCVLTPLWIHSSSFETKDAQQKRTEEIRNEHPLPLLLSVGRSVYYKGHNILIEAMKLINARLLIIGEGPDVSALQQQIQENQLSDRVQIIPPVDDLAPYYYAAEVFVFPSTQPSEAFGIVQLEAMACGLPVINTYLPTGVPWVSLHCETGITVPPNNVIALVSAMQELLSDKPLRTLYSQNAKKRVLLFNRAEIAQRISIELKRVVQTSS